MELHSAGRDQKELSKIGLNSVGETVHVFYAIIRLFRKVPPKKSLTFEVFGVCLLKSVDGSRKALVQSLQHRNSSCALRETQKI